MQILKDAFEDYEKKLLKASEYSGANVKKEVDGYILSASMLANDDLQNYYKIKSQPREQLVFGANTFGSIYQLGVDKAFEGDERYESAKRITLPLIDKWYVSGEMDQIDHERKIIFDNKVISGTEFKKIRSYDKNGKYNLQLGVYRWLMWKETGEDYNTALVAIDKSFSLYKNDKHNFLNFIAMSTHEPEEMEKILIEKAKLLQEFLDLDIEPAQCKNLFWYKQKDGRSVPMRCIHYCDYAAQCKYYSDYSAEKMLFSL